MWLFLVHHADALAPNIDAMRPLSTVGQKQAARVAAALRERGAKPAVIWHSGKLRARQTAEACYSALNPFAEFAAARGLQPDDDPATIVAILAAETRDALIASHMPFLPALLHRLSETSVGFPLNGCVALERVADRWEERWRVEP